MKIRIFLRIDSRESIQFALRIAGPSKIRKLADNAHMSKRASQDLLKKGGANSRAAKRGCFKRGGFPIWTCPSFFVLFCPFGTFPGIFPICSGMVRGFSRFVLFLFLGLLRAPTRNSPERVRDTIWTFPEKSGKHPGLETPRFSFSQQMQEMERRVITESEFGGHG